jgi:hypothetical protein
MSTSGRVLVPGLLSWAALIMLGAAVPPAQSPPDAGAKRWNDDQLVAAYGDLASKGGLEAAVRSPSLPKDPLQPRFLEALAWYAAGSPGKPGELTLERLDGQIQDNVHSYLGLLKAKVERGENNDYARTRTWKLIQKYTVLRDEMSKPARKGRYAYPALAKEGGGPEVDTWDQAHTLRSPDEFAEKVCKASHDRPVLVKFGNTNCSECMLFEILGSVRAIADNAAHKGSVDVYKVWWGYQPDESFTGRIRDPERLNDLVKAEGVTSSPFFMVYRDGRATPCGDAFPDDHGSDERIESCLRQDPAKASESKTCASLTGGK